MYLLVLVLTPRLHRRHQDKAVVRDGCVTVWWSLFCHEQQSSEVSIRQWLNRTAFSMQLQTLSQQESSVLGLMTSHTNLFTRREATVYFQWVNPDSIYWQISLDVHSTVLPRCLCTEHISPLDCTLCQCVDREKLMMSWGKQCLFHCSSASLKAKNTQPLPSSGHLC